MPGLSQLSDSVGTRWGWEHISNAFPVDSATAGQEIRHCKPLLHAIWDLPRAQAPGLSTEYILSESNDTKMKYKGKIKYIKVLIRLSAWFSLRLSWFLLCPGYVGSVLIFMASVSPMCCHFHLLRGRLYTLFLSWCILGIRLIIANRTLRTNVEWGFLYLPKSFYTSLRINFISLSLHRINMKPEPLAYCLIF